jgi:hypothetical protein
MADNGYTFPIPMTAAGYQEAKRYLEFKGHSDLIEKERSVDGYTVIALANDLHETESRS